jgi:uncharacterized protein (DUF1015 family)
VGALSDVVAPPYDVIDAALQDELYNRSPFNVVRLILNREEATDDARDNRYTRAARFLRDWQAEGVLCQDSARCVYVYHQEFEVDGERHIRRGVLARVRLEALGQGKVFAHEETFPGPKADRLKLFRATGMNLSPVFALYPDDAGEVQRLLDEAVRKSLPLEARDKDGVTSRLWAVADQHVTSSLTGMMSPKPIFIADGHHRYETALAYLNERRAAGEVPNDDGAAHFVLMMLVGMSDPGLLILPTHRLVSGPAGLTAEKLRDALGTVGQIVDVRRGDKSARDTWELLRAEGSQQVLGFGTASDQTWQLIRFADTERMNELAPEHSPEWRGLGVSLLHVLVLGRMLKDHIGEAPEIRYVHDANEAGEAVARKQCSLAVLVPPASMADLQQIAGNREKMPQKSTYFYPKVLSGLVFNPLTGS